MLGKRSTTNNSNIVRAANIRRREVEAQAMQNVIAKMPACLKVPVPCHDDHDSRPSSITPDINNEQIDIRVNELENKLENITKTLDKLRHKIVELGYFINSVEIEKKKIDVSESIDYAELQLFLRENAHSIVSTAVKTSALKIHETIRCLMHPAQSVAESITSNKETLEVLKSELEGLRQGGNPIRKAFLDFIEHCWNQLPEYIEKQDPNRTQWPPELTSNRFFEEFAYVICAQFYEVSPERLIESQWSLSELLCLAHPDLPAGVAAEVEASYAAIALVSPREISKTLREKFYNKRRHHNQNVKKQRLERLEMWKEMRQASSSSADTPFSIANQGMTSTASAGTIYSPDHRTATDLSVGGTNKRRKQSHLL
mmetsp:Transcript_14616/g.24199  ORF Transcript_14616/g.24199 Transcript_14616/m.24199 type:complete len:371 (+) Transcript_14616:29-1141(+)